MGRWATGELISDFGGAVPERKDVDADPTSRSSAPNSSFCAPRPPSDGVPSSSYGDPSSSYGVPFPSCGAASDREDTLFTAGREDVSFTADREDVSFTAGREDASFIAGREAASFTAGREDASFTAGREGASFTAGATADTTEGNSRTSRESGLLCSPSHGESIASQSVEAKVLVSELVHRACQSVRVRAALWSIPVAPASGAGRGRGTRVLDA